MAETEQRLGIICAMQIELTDILEQSSTVTERRIGRRIYYEAVLNGCPIVATVCGIGKVNAASTTQELITVFEPSMVVNSGIAGALADGLRPGDVVLATGLDYHDFDLGYFTELPVPLATDEGLLSLAQQTAEEQIPGQWVAGLIVSGDAFIQSQAVKEDIIQRTQALAVDMESASVAQVATLNACPVLIIRSISDLADDDADATYDDFEAQAAARSAALLAALASRLVTVH